MTPERWQQVKTLLSEALELDTGRQRQFLDSACANDVDLRTEIDLFLAQRVDTSSDMMEQCAADAALMRYQQALKIREDLYSTARADTYIQRDLAEVWLKLGDALTKKGARTEALAYYRLSLETLEALATSIPAHAGIRTMLADAKSRFAHAD